MRFILNRKCEFIIYYFIINDTILYPLGGGGLKTSVDTEICCPKGKCGCQYLILLTLKKKSWTQGSWIF
jgi:hypothetical protein